MDLLIEERKMSDFGGIISLSNCSNAENHAQICQFRTTEISWCILSTQVLESQHCHQCHETVLIV